MAREDPFADEMIGLFDYELIPISEIIDIIIA